MINKILVFTFLTLSYQLSATDNDKTQKKIDSLSILLDSDLPALDHANVLYDIIELYFFHKPEEAYEYIVLYNSLASETKNEDLLFEGHMLFASFFSFTNNYQSSLEYVYKAFDLAKKNKSKKAFLHAKLSELFGFMNELDQSIYHARKALEVNIEIKDSLQMTYDYHNIAMWYLETDKFDSSLYYLHKGIAVFKKLELEPNPIYISHLGQAHAYLDNFDSALYYHFRALALDTENNSKYEVALDESYISNTYLRKKKYDKAILYATKSLERAKELDLVDVMLYNYELFYEIYEQKQNYEEAFKYAILRNDYADSLREKNRESIIQGLNSKYKYNEQKQLLQSQEAENNLLKKQKTLLIFISVLTILFLLSLIIIIIQETKKHKANQNLLAELKEANDSKEKLISVISHDLRSSIGTLRNSIQLINDDEFDAESITELLADFFPVVDSTYDLLENLLTWAAYNKGKLEPTVEILDLKPIINKSILHTYHLANSKNIEIVNRVEDAIITADRNMISTVIRNLLSNAVKFSHPKSEVIISSKSNGDMIEIIVMDSGMGMKPEVLDQIFTNTSDYHSKGTQGERGSGLGLSICKSFIENMSGTIKVQSTLGKGSIFVVSIPVV